MLNRVASHFHSKGFATTFSSMAASVLLLLLASGVFIGTFRTDELFFMHGSWAQYSGSESVAYLPPTFHLLLVEFWRLVNGDILGAPILRAILLGIALIQWVGFYYLVKVGFGPGWRTSFSPPALVTSSAMMFVIASFRGYEVRPEVIPNTILIFSFLAIIREKLFLRQRVIDFILLAGLVALISLAPSFSFRYALPAFFLLILVFYRVWCVQDKRWIQLIAYPSVALVVFLAANLIPYNLFDEIRRAAELSEGRISKTIWERLTAGGGKWYDVILIVALFAITYFAVLTTKEAATKGHRRSMVAPFLALLPLLSFYLFLFAFDQRPYGYVRSIEWILIFGAAAVIGYENIKIGSGARANVLGRRLLYVLLACTVLSCATLLDQRSPAALVRCISDNLSIDEFRALSDATLVHQMRAPSSLIEQVRSRSVLCGRYPKETVAVESYMDHPICMRDGGSYTLSGWGGVADLRKLVAEEFPKLFIVNDDIAREVVRLFPGQYSASDGLVVRRDCHGH
jgi:hypothetical protein